MFLVIQEHVVHFFRRMDFVHVLVDESFEHSYEMDVEAWFLPLIPRVKAFIVHTPVCRDKAQQAVEELRQPAINVGGSVELGDSSCCPAVTYRRAPEYTRESFVGQFPFAQ